MPHAQPAHHSRRSRAGQLAPRESRTARVGLRKSPSEQWWKKFPPFGEMVAKRLAQIRKHTFGGYQFEHLWKLTQAFIKQRNKDFTIPRTVKSGSIIKRGTSSASDASARSPRA